MFFRYLFCPSNFRALHPLPTQTQQFAKQIVADPMCTPTKACPVAPPAHLRLEGSQDQCPGYLPEWCHHGGTMEAGNVQTFDQKDHQLSSTLIAWPWHTSLYQHGTCCFKVSPFLSPLPLTRQEPPSVIFQEARLQSIKSSASTPDHGDGMGMWRGKGSSKTSGFHLGYLGPQDVHVRFKMKLSPDVAI